MSDGILDKIFNFNMYYVWSHHGIWFYNITMLLICTISLLQLFSGHISQGGRFSKEAVPHVIQTFTVTPSELLEL